MSGAQHTPGEWRLREDRPGFWSVSTELSCINGLSAWFTLATFEWDASADGYSEGAFSPEADARIFHAGPDMLDALKLAQRFIENGIEFGFDRWQGFMSRI